MLQHAVCEAGADRVAVLSFLDARSAEEQEVVRREISEEVKALRTHGRCASYAASLRHLLESDSYGIIIAGSKGICQVHAALESHVQESYRLPKQVGLVLLNGAEAPAAMDVGAGAFGPDFAAEAAQFIGHAKVCRLVVTSHGAEASASFRRAVRRGTAAASAQSIVVYTALDSRCLPNRETHSLPWSLTFPEECWFPGFGKPPRLVNADGTTAEIQSSGPVPLLYLVRWAGAFLQGPGGGSQSDLEPLLQIPQFPGPPRFAEIRIEIARIGNCCPSEVVFQPLGSVQTPGMGPSYAPLGSSGIVFEGDVYDILFDSQVSELQVVLKDIRSGCQTHVNEILAQEGQYAVRRVRFFRYYEEKSAKIGPLLHSEAHPDATEQDLQIQELEFMIHELLCMNKNLGNFLWTGFMTPATAFSPTNRFGADLLEVVVEVELARLGGVYRGFSRGRVDAEHSLVGHYSLTGRHGSRKW
ncbi:unnamed protein product [Symbiodinium sp. CCMP2592]|nr:unnamed protein product [Symbiodinium sp. CCMP2592]